MQAQLISHTPNNTRLMLIFSGWSTNPGFYSSLHAEGWDIMLVFDYSRPGLDIAGLDRYSTVFLLAWSLGVAAAETAAASGWLDTIRISGAIAVNGTPYPADDTRGIPEAIYDGTEASLSLKNLKRFRRRMAEPPVSDAPFTLDSDTDENASIERLKSELRTLREYHASLRLPWLRAYVGNEDRIFPAENQVKAWSDASTTPQIVRLAAGHYIRLQDIVTEITPDHARIGSRFRRAVDTYDLHAVAQNRIVQTLCKLLPESFKARTDLKLIEIGAGSGRLTRAIGEIITPSHATFVDLYPLPNFGIAREEEYVVADAEQWLDSVDPASTDILATASTIQWFADPRRFFANASRILRQDGVLLCSTFMPGNLSELDILRPSPLLYRYETELRRFVTEYFGSSHFESEEIQIGFNSPREALLHLKLTGVGGGSRANTRNLLTSLPEKPTLTYRPLYIFASNPKKI